MQRKHNIIVRTLCYKGTYVLLICSSFLFWGKTTVYYKTRIKQHIDRTYIKRPHYWLNLYFTCRNSWLFFIQFFIQVSISFRYICKSQDDFFHKLYSVLRSKYNNYNLMEYRLIKLYRLENTATLYYNIMRCIRRMLKKNWYYILNSNASCVYTLQCTVYS